MLLASVLVEIYEYETLINIVDIIKLNEYSN